MIHVRGLTVSAGALLLVLQLQAQQVVSSNFCAKAIAELQKDEPLTNAIYLVELNGIRGGAKRVGFGCGEDRLGACAI